MAGYWIGLSGAQRTGKTTLAEAFANKHGFRMCYAGIAGIQKAIGADSKVLDQDFTERMFIQEAILAKVTERYKEEHAKGGNCIWDRTPYDFITYTLMSIGPATTAEEWTLVEEYIRKCKVLLMYFDKTVIVLPGIPLVEDGKSLCNAAYINKFTSILLGESRFDTDNEVIPAPILDLQLRINLLGELTNA